MCIKAINTGIHTYSVHKTLTANQFYMIKATMDNPRITGSEYWTNKESYCDTGLKDQGITLYLAKKNNIYSFKVRIEPCLVLGSEDPTELYRPTKKSYHKLEKIINHLLAPYDVPCSLEKMKICRMDITADLLFENQESVLDYIHVLKKSSILPYYHLDFFHQKEKKAKDCKKANMHSYKLQCKSAAFFAYDKIAQLEMTNRLDNTFIGKKILRLEAELKRTAFKKQLKQQDNSFAYLKAGAKRSKHIISWYLKRLQLVRGDHLRYEDAVSIIENTQKGKKMRKRMLHLLEKTSNSKSLSAAITKTKVKYGLTAGQINRLLKKFDKLGISPITVSNTRKIDGITNLRVILDSPLVI